MPVEVITYANREFGLFQKLVNNQHSVPIKVLGMGTEWKGFNDKYRGVLAYLKKYKSDSDIVVFVDGFDTLVNRNLLGFEQKFRETGAGIVVSKDILVSWVPTLLGRYISDRIFGTCKSNHTANTGMYVGFTKHITTVLTEALKMSCQDDQANMNTLCSAYEFVKVDKDCIFFENISFGNTKTSESYFVSYPGTPSLNRIHRSLLDYAQFFIIEFVVIAIIALTISPRTAKPRVIVTIASIVTMYIGFADKSCSHAP